MPIKTKREKLLVGDSNRPMLDKREFSTVLAALRFWQSKIGPDRLPAQASAKRDFEPYFEDGKKFAPLSMEEIDSLCERINVSEDEDAEAYRAAAKSMFEDEGTLEIDGNAIVSIGDDPGAYVEAWVWVPQENI
jgi:hypothetical protein